MPKAPTKSRFGAERAAQSILTRFNPIRGLTPARLSTQLDAFWAGRLRGAALLWQKILERDDQVKTCAAKRARMCTGLPLQVLMIDDSEEAKRHKAALEYFYNNLRATNALDENEQGGLQMLLRQMHGATGMRYAAHEIVWRPVSRDEITAEFRFIPLQFFENTAGRLRFLKADFADKGEELDEFFGPGGWMVVAGEGLMEASSVAYMFKSMPLKAWIRFAEKFGIPGLHAQTEATKGSDEWAALKQALQGFGEDLALITNLGAKIEAIELKGSGESPHAKIVDRMDRALSRLWLGGDLATMSAGDAAVGSQPQSDDLAELQRDDAARLSDALQHFVDRWVIRHLYDAEPMAYAELQVPDDTDTTRELAIDDKLVGWGVEIGLNDLRQRYGRNAPAEGEPVAKAPAAASPFGPPPFPRAINEAGARAAVDQLVAAKREDFAPLIAKLDALQAATDPVAYAGALRDLRATAAAMAPQILREPRLGQALHGFVAEAAAKGAVATLRKVPA